MAPLHSDQRSLTLKVIHKTAPIASPGQLWRWHNVKHPAPSYPEGLLTNIVQASISIGFIVLHGIILATQT